MRPASGHRHWPATTGGGPEPVGAAWPGSARWEGRAGRRDGTSGRRDGGEEVGVPPSGWPDAAAPWPALPDSDGAGPAPVGGSERAGGPWPALPDDRPLWTVAASALDDERVRRLDREQAGG
ncbi:MULTISPECIES: hypothetical protein [unclassified Micromonospora]|uniref:hypothetical protein n=1 Tax=unclassified Micromonospora TaxID=2617518 RepID=UPI00331F062E